MPLTDKDMAKIRDLAEQGHAHSAEPKARERFAEIAKLVGKAGPAKRAPARSRK